jgi:hypothetical protein
MGDKAARVLSLELDQEGDRLRARLFVHLEEQQEPGQPLLYGAGPVLAGQDRPEPYGTEVRPRMSCQVVRACSRPSRTSHRHPCHPFRRAASLLSILKASVGLLYDHVMTLHALNGKWNVGDALGVIRLGYTAAATVFPPLQRELMPPICSHPLCWARSRCIPPTLEAQHNVTPHPRPP